MRILLATVLVAAALSATTEPATDLTATTATLHGSVDDATGFYFQYGTPTDPHGLTTVPKPVTDGDAPTPVTAPLTNLTANTTYHYRVAATNGAQTEFGQDRTFTTAPNPLPPSVSSQHRRDITPTSANVSAALNPRGGQTTYYFQYGTSTNYGTRTPDPPAQAGAATTATTVTAALTGLRPYTRYHWRLVATNAAGTTRGPDRTFTTARAPSAVSLGLSRTTVAWGSGLSLGGRVTGPGSVALTVALQQQRFPFDVGFNEIATARTSSGGGYLFTIDNLLGATRFRVVTRTQQIVTSPVVTARAAVRAGIGVRILNRKRARVAGSIVPAVHGTVSLQRRLASGRWRQVRVATVQPAGERTTYSLKVWRARRTGKTFRVIARPERGAYVRGTSAAVVVSRRPGRARGSRAAGG